MTLKAGMDIDCSYFVGQHGRAAYDAGLIDASLLDARLSNLFNVRMRLQHFDPPGPLTHVERGRAGGVALRAACGSIAASCAPGGPVKCRGRGSCGGAARGGGRAMSPKPAQTRLLVGGRGCEGREAGEGEGGRGSGVGAGVQTAGKGRRRGGGKGEGGREGAGWRGDLGWRGGKGALASSSSSSRAPRSSMRLRRCRLFWNLRPPRLQRVTRTMRKALANRPHGAAGRGKKRGRGGDEGHGKIAGQGSARGAGHKGRGVRGGRQRRGRRARSGSSGSGCRARLRGPLASPWSASRFDQTPPATR